MAYNPRIPHSEVAMYEFAPHRNPYDFSELQEAIGDYLEAEEPDHETYDAIEIMSSGWLGQDRCLGAPAVVTGEAYVRADDDKLLPYVGIFFGQYQAITRVYHEEIGCHLLYHQIQPAPLPTLDATSRASIQANLLVPLFSKHIAVYPEPTFSDPSIADLIDIPREEHHHMKDVQTAYERLQFEYPDEVALLFAKLHTHYATQKRLFALQTNRAFVESEGEDYVVSSANTGKPLLFRGTVIDFFEMELPSKEDGLSTEMVPTIATLASTQYSAAPTLVKIPVSACETITQLETA